MSRKAKEVSEISHSVFQSRVKGIDGGYELSATLAKSGPLDFPSEKSFLLFFAREKGLGHMFQK